LAITSPTSGGVEVTMMLVIHIRVVLGSKPSSKPDVLDVPWYFQRNVSWFERVEVTMVLVTHIRVVLGSKPSGKPDVLDLPWYFQRSVSVAPYI
jgi:hypothetical protein